jgi:hypothetical protein
VGDAWGGREGPGHQAAGLQAAPTAEAGAAPLPRHLTLTPLGSSPPAAPKEALRRARAAAHWRIGVHGLLLIGCDVRRERIHSPLASLPLPSPLLPSLPPSDPTPQEGTRSGTFALAVCFSLVVMYDASGVRLHAGRAAAVLNHFLGALPDDHQLAGLSLRDKLGHEPEEVAAGAVVGVLVGWMVAGVLGPSGGAGEARLM